ncbi:glycosyltransferase [Marvinbryantia formatexigens]|nr:glycosyltransferase [Marvinbryantia formatexigens]
MTDPELGINKKINEQIENFRKAGFSVDAFYRKHDSQLICRHDKEIVVKAGMHRPFKIEASKYLKRYIKGRKYDGAYIRYVYGDWQFFRLLKYLKKQKIVTVIEVPTYPYDKELTDSLENKVVLFLDKCYRNRMHRYVDRIVTFSGDKQIFGIQTIRTMNGVNFEKIKSVSGEHPYDGKINMIAVADLAKWHGYDRILEGIGAYYRQGGKREVVFHLVGNGPELEEYKRIIEKWHIEKHVVLYGQKFGKELEQIYEKCNVAAESFGRHRSGHNYSTSLKSKEYVAKGLPVIASSEIDVFSKSGSRYFKRFPADESPVDIEKVIVFCDSVYKSKSRKEVIDDIRGWAIGLCDFKVVMEPVFQFFKNTK